MICCVSHQFCLVKQRQQSHPTLSQGHITRPPPTPRHRPHFISSPPPSPPPSVRSVFCTCKHTPDLILIPNVFFLLVSPNEGMVCEKGIQILLTTVGAFAAFGLMTVAIGTDYWLYSRAVICNSTANVSQDDPHNKDKKDPGALTHSGLWRICCLEGKEDLLALVRMGTSSDACGIAPALV